MRHVALLQCRHHPLDAKFIYGDGLRRQRHAEHLETNTTIGHKTSNTYDANDNLASTTDPLGNVTCYTYDASGNRTSTTLPQAGPNCSSVQSSTTYNQFSEPVQTIDELGNVRTFNYDINYNPVSVTDSLGTLQWPLTLLA